MNQTQLVDETSVQGVVQLLRQIVQLYKELGPQSMESRNRLL